MSRIGKQPVPIPAGVQVQFENETVTVKGPKGEIQRKLHRDMILEVDEGEIRVRRPSDSKEHKSLHGLTRTLVANMVKGVTDGYVKELEIKGVGYRAAKQGNKLVLTVGYSHPVEMEPPAGIEFEVPAPTRIAVQGDRQGARRRGGREHPSRAGARTVLGQGDHVRRREDPPQGR